MKLNSRGWGYRMMIFLISVLSIFILLAIYFISRFYDNFNTDKYQSSIKIEEIYNI